MREFVEVVSSQKADAGIFACFEENATFKKAKRNKDKSVSRGLFD